MKQIKVAKLWDDAKLPTRKHPNDAGMDLYAYITHDATVGIPCFEQSVLDTGITVSIPEGYVGLVWPKSRHSFLIGGGVIDAGYQGEIKVRVINPYSSWLEFKNGDPIAQLLLMPIVTPEIVEESYLTIHQKKTERGTSGGIHEAL